jgi:hypothetical protein
MNQERESSGNPAYETQIERRLKQARPRPPQWDVASIEQLAREPMMDASVEKPGAVVPRPGSWQRGRWDGRRVMDVAASWACGAMVGVLVTFVLMSRMRPGTASSDAASQGIATQRAAGDARDVSPVEPGSAATPSAVGTTGPSKQAPPDADAVALAMLPDRWRNEDFASWQHVPALRARMHPRDGIAGSSRPGDETAGQVPANEPRSTAETRRPPESYPDPAPATARGPLLHRLLETSGSVL